MQKRLFSFLMAFFLLGGASAAALFAFSPCAQAQQIGIAAVVNDEAITTADVESRVRLALLGAGGETSPEAIKRLRDQIVQNMIDERIMLQEAKKLDLSVDETTIDSEAAALSQQNGIPVEHLPAFLASKGVPVSALRDQIRAKLAWGLVVQRSIRPRIAVADDEVDAEIARLQANAGEPEYLLGDIFLPVDSPADEDKVYQTGIRLIEQMARGARFSALARQFSQDFSAASGGDLGWVRLSDVDAALVPFVRKMNAGTVSPPLRTAQGFHIIMLRQMREGVGGGALSSQGGGGHDPSSVSPSPVSSSPVAPSPVSPPSAAAFDRTAITNKLGNEKLELQARRYLRDLRQEAFVDIR